MTKIPLENKKLDDKPQIRTTRSTSLLKIKQEQASKSKTCSNKSSSLVRTHNVKTSTRVTRSSFKSNQNRDLKLLPSTRLSTSLQKHNIKTQTSVIRSSLNVSSSCNLKSPAAARLLGQSSLKQKLVQPRSFTRITQSSHTCTSIDHDEVQILQLETTKGKIFINNMISSEQLAQILATVRDTLTPAVPVQPQPQHQGKSFSKCTIRFNGDRKDLEHFVNTVLVFKDSENVSDEVALKSFPLLLTGEAGIWWQGIKNTATTFDDAINLFKSNYEIVKQPYQIYMEIFSSDQGVMNTDSFICKKRALFAKLPDNPLSEAIQLDMIYGMLSLSIRSKVPRGEIETFKDLIDKARHVEALFCEEPKNNSIKIKNENQSTSNNKSNKYCRYCHNRGHEISECRKRSMKNQLSVTPSSSTSVTNHESNKSKETPQTARDSKSDIKPAIRCYGCNEPGVIKSNCKKCNDKSTTSAFATDFSSNASTVPSMDDDIISSALQSLSFSSLTCNITPQSRPQVIVQILNQKGSALIDTAAKSCIASNSLSSVFIKNNLIFNSIDLPVSLADGSTKILKSRIFKINVTLQNKIIPTTFIVFPECNVKHTLLGIDFIVNAKLILNFSNSKWKFADREVWFDMNFEITSQKTVDISSLQTLRENEGTNLSSDEKDQVIKLLTAHEGIFVPGGAPTSHAEHHILLQDPNSVPIAMPPYRMSSEKQNILKSELKKMLCEDVIEECESPWAAPVVLIPKPDKSFRVCIDYRKLNACTVSDKYPMPQIDDLLHLAKETLYMSTIDLKSGYWQVPVAEVDRDKTAFVTPFGLFRFKRMPFGLKNAPATFQRLINRFKTGLPGLTILCYLDDIIVLSKSFGQHLSDLQQVFQHLASYNLIANREKCSFFKNEVKFLGHVITSSGIKVNPDKVNVIVDMPEPKNVRHLKGFLQTCSWYRKFVPKFSDISRPLSELTRKSAKWIWSDIHSNAFNKLKQLLTTAPILKQVEENKPFILRTDASNYALGAVLLQTEDSEERPIEYASRLLTSAERNYNTTEREALAVVWALQKYRGYIDGAEVEVCTDHQALKWLMSLRVPSGRLARWVLLIQSFNVKISYTPGKSNVIADMLSRPICSDISSCGVCSIEIDLPSKGSKMIRDSQLEDPEILKIINCFETPNHTDINNWVDRGYMVEGGVLYRFNPDSDSEEPQLVVPSTSRLEILKSYHNDPSAGHIGIEPTIQKVSLKYYWVGMRKFITEYIKSCPECQRYKISNLKPAGLLKTPVMSQRHEVLAIDLFGPLVETVEGFNHILVVEDTATKWTELYALKLASAENCAKTLINEWFMRFGLPRRIISDNGVQFVSNIMQQVADYFKIHQNLIPRYHPAANPVERRNRDIKTRLAILVKENHECWSDYLPAIRFSLNSTRSESTGYSPAYLSFGRELRNISDVSHDTRPIISDENFIPQITPFLSKLNEVVKSAREINEIQQDKRKFYADKKRREHNFKIGDLVLVKTQILSNKEKRVTSKFVPKRDGPYRIKEFKSSVSCDIETIQNSFVGTYHVSHLTPYVGDPNLEISNPIRKRGRPRKMPTVNSNINTSENPVISEDEGDFQGFTDSDIIS